MRTLLSAFILCVASAASVTATAGTTMAQSADTVNTLHDMTVRYAAPVELTAHDFVTKVYGLIDPDSSREETVGKARDLLSLTPEEDDLGLWLESANGYRVSYYGMQPDVSAMAQFENDAVADFGFFFLFPYDTDSREAVNLRQAEFCGSLLQEMHDLGMTMGVNPMSDAIFEAQGDYEGNSVEVRLIDEHYTATPDSGRFVLLLSVEPGAGIPAMDQEALTLVTP